MQGAAGAFDGAGAHAAVALHPARAKPGPAAMVVGEDDFPGVTHEVKAWRGIRNALL
ncbi:MAG: hypothetical protein OXP69_16440 [Spirochaetaceae bacterium]|nr:hypothetical protein [Spirochaetaceae bacterium]